MNTELKKGDILVFKADNDNFLSKCIAWFTGSDVDHAALLYSDHQIAELTAIGASIKKVAISEGRDAYIMRHTGDVDAKKLLETTDRYVAAHTPYDFPGLLILAGLMLTRKIIPDKRLLPVIEQIIMLGSKALDDMMQKVMKYEEHAMVCSQFVYQVYWDSGYHIDIDLYGNDGTVSNPPFISLLSYYREQDIENLWDNAIEQGFLSGSLSDSSPPEETLYELLTSSDENTFFTGTNDIYKDLLPAIGAFTKRLEHFKSAAGYADMPIDSMFVTPADLVRHGKNLELVGYRKIERTV